MSEFNDHKSVCQEGSGWRGGGGVQSSALELVKALLDDTNTYEKRTSDPTRAIKNKLIQTLKEWRKEKRIPNYLYNQLYPTAENVPKFYGLPKIHKKDVPLRPIVSSIGSVMYDTAKFLAKIMKPLVGLNSHHIVNSEDFVNKIAELEVPPGQKLVSYDVSSLFTSIPINEAIPVVRAKLESDQSLPDRCPLDIAQLSVLLEMCLSSTYFTFHGEFYKQKKGAAMGSPISPVVANLYMEQFESRALDTAPTPPTMWYRYVDDTMAKIHENAVDSFSEHLNSIDQHIQFTSEQEKDGRIPFLDTCVSINQDGSTKISVYRKPTHTDQYLNFQSNHHLQHKRAVVNTLMLRAQTLVTENDDRTRETQHVKQALKMNNMALRNCNQETGSENQQECCIEKYMLTTKVSASDWVASDEELTDSPDTEVLDNLQPMSDDPMTPEYNFYMVSDALSEFESLHPELFKNVPLSEEVTEHNFISIDNE
ncbi:uncharacterized protein [Montipora capricornis]|uniref:uncharacterized protein n=1 Tax=Montipora capricornis TaxID=246305 RepID=UPI0035F1B315